MCVFSRQKDSVYIIEAWREQLKDSLLKHPCLPELRDVAATLNRRSGMWSATGLKNGLYAEVH